MPTPTMTGGQGLEPDSATRRMTNSRTPFQPWAGASIMTRDMFSEPPPLAIMVILSLSPGTRSKWTMAGELSPTFLRVNGSQVDLRKKPSR